MEESREFLTLRRAEAQAAAACAISEDERTLHRELADYYAQRLAQMTNLGPGEGASASLL
jgi:hypothetical protein